MRYIRHSVWVLFILGTVASAASVVLSPETIAAHAVHTQPSCSYAKKENNDCIWKQSIEGLVQRAEKMDDLQLLQHHCHANELEGEHLFYALIRAAEKGNCFAMRNLLALGTDINGIVAGLSGETPLIAAASAGRLDAVRLLLKRGAWPNVPGRNGETPLVAALRHTEVNKLSLLQLLLKYGADPNGIDKQGATALFHVFRAARQHSLAVAQLLLDSGAAMEQIDKAGENILGIPHALGAFPEEIAWFAKHGASVQNTQTGCSRLLLQMCQNFAKLSDNSMSKSPRLRLWHLQRYRQNISELAQRGAQLAPGEHDRLNLHCALLILRGQVDRYRTIQKVLTELHPVPGTVRTIIRQFSDDETERLIAQFPEELTVAAQCMQVAPFVLNRLIYQFVGDTAMSI